jgi:hypothetical protein
MMPLNSRNSSQRNYGSECTKLPKSCQKERKAAKAASRRADNVSFDGEE